MNKLILYLGAITGIVLLGISNYPMMSSFNNVRGSQEDSAVDSFNQWKLQFNVNYSSEEENQYRQLVFTENYLMIQQHNSDPSQTFQMGINFFADRTVEEFRSTYLTVIQSPDPEEKSPEDFFIPDPDMEIQEELNWAQKNVLPPVKNQGSCGSCWAFSAVAVLESTNVIYNNVSVVAFSEQNILDCTTRYYDCFGCNGGYPSGALYYSQFYGVATQSSYPYYGYRGRCQQTQAVFAPAGQKLVYPTVERFMKTLNVQPISVCVDATNWMFYRSGVFNSCSSSYQSLNHAVTLVGYDSNNQWIVRNSWGREWGNEGYITLSSGNTCGVLHNGVIAYV